VCVYIHTYALDKRNGIVVVFICARSFKLTTYTRGRRLAVFAIRFVFSNLSLFAFLTVAHLPSGGAAFYV